MRNLLGYYLKRDKWILIAMAGIPLLGSLIMTSEMGPIINFMALWLVTIAGSLLLVYRDYKRFYGAYSHFFDALPLTGREVMGARLVWFLSIALYVIAIALLKALEFIVRIDGRSIDFQAFSNTLQQVLGKIPTHVYVIFILAAIVSIVFNVVTWLFISSVGSEKSFRRFGIGGPILLYVAVNVGYGILSSLSARLAGGRFGYLEALQNGMTQTEMIHAISNYFTLTTGILTAVCVVAIIFGFWRSVKSHNEKLSVY